MAIYINFKTVKVNTLSGGGVFIGQNLAFGWDSFTKSNTGISNGNNSPISNAITIIDDRDIIDAPILDNDHPVVKLNGGEIRTGDGHKNNPSETHMSNPGNHKIIIKKNGQEIYPLKKPDDSQKPPKKDPKNDKNSDPKKEKNGDDRKWQTKDVKATSSKKSSKAKKGTNKITFDKDKK